MKKLLSFILCFVVFFTVVGCSNNSASLDDINSLKDEIFKLQDEINALKENEQSKLPDLADCEIGYMLETYPKCEFQYKISDDCVVTITSITAELTAKNTINSGDMLDEAFYPYSVTFVIKGSIIGTPPYDNDGVKLWVDLYSNNIVPPAIRIKPDNSGNFEHEFTKWMSENSIIYFLGIR